MEEVKPVQEDKVDKATERAKRKEAKKLGKLNKTALAAVSDSKQESHGKEENTAQNIRPRNDEASNNKKDENVISKSELRAQRRAIQEAQRQAKTQVKTLEKKPGDKTIKEDQKDIGKPAKASNTSSFKQTENDTSKSFKPKLSVLKDENSFNDQQYRVQLFNHLYLERKLSQLNLSVPAVLLKLGAQYASKTILGSNARCLALLSALKTIVSEHSSPQNQEFCRSLEADLQNYTTFLSQCRLMAVSMTNALKNFKWQLTQVNTALSDAEKKEFLLESIDKYIQEEILIAGKAISISAGQKISDGDTILTYGSSSLIKKIFLDSYEKGKKFKVIVVDSRPLLEGREMLRVLVQAGIRCSYVMINGASFVMGKVNKVLLGAHALLANGCVMSRMGTAQVALVAKDCNKPVLVCCETYKFSERVQTDSYVFNEIGDPERLRQVDSLGEPSPLVDNQMKHLTPFSLMYDVTPPDLVSAVVTELAILPCTSVPVVLRVKPTEII